MIWSSSFHGRLAQAADFVTVLCGFIAAYFLWMELFSSGLIGSLGLISLELKHLVLVIVLSFIYTLLFLQAKAYSYQRFTSLITEYTIVFKVCLLGLLFIVFSFFMLGDKELPRSFIIVDFLMIFILLIIEKTILFYFAAITRRLGWSRKRTLIVGTENRAQNFIKTIEKNYNWGLDILGLISSDKSRVGEKVSGYPIIGSKDNIEKILKEYNPEEVIVTASIKRFDYVQKIIELCEHAGIQVKLNSDFFGHIARKINLYNIFGLNLISYSLSERNEFQLFIKRIIDIIISALGLVLLAPLFVVVSLIIIFQDGFPIFYRWEIVGYNRIPIRSWKFRTMVKNADELKEKLMAQNEMTGPVFKIADDPRILPIGRFLRRFSIDELPQLFSVLKGDLSLVGPRPPLQHEFKKFELWQRRKLSVKPGLTCLWQISGRNNISDFDEWLKLDLDYIDNWSLLLDFKILLKTFRIVLSGEGAK